MTGMASVILISTDGTDVSVSTTREFNYRVYGQGWMPKVGTVEENFEILAADAGSPTPRASSYVAVNDLTDLDSPVNAILRDNYVAVWAPYEPVEAGDVRVSPTGLIITRTTDGTTRGAYDATEAGTWSASAGGGGGTGVIPDEYIVEAELTAALEGYVSDDDLATALAGYAPVGHNHDAAYVSDDELATALATYATTASVTSAVNTASTADRARANHTGTQASSTLSDLTETVQDIVAAFISPGTGLTKTYDDAGNLLTLTATSGGGTTDPEVVRDTIGSALVAGTGVNIVLNDAGDTITISSTAVLPTRTISTGTGLSGGGDLSANRTISITFGTTAGTAVEGNDSRLSNSRTPTAHATSHASGGSDPVTPAAIGAVASTSILTDVVITQAAYDALATKVSTTRYNIVG